MISTFHYAEGSVKANRITDGTLEFLHTGCGKEHASPRCPGTVSLRNGYDMKTASTHEKPYTGQWQVRLLSTQQMVPDCVARCEAFGHNYIA